MMGVCWHSTAWWRSAQSDWLVLVSRVLLHPVGVETDFVFLTKRGDYYSILSFVKRVLVVFRISAAMNLRRVERTNLDTHINPHYLACTQLTFDKKDLLDTLFDETGDVRSVEVVGDPAPGTAIVCV